MMMRAEVADDEQRQDKAGRFPRLEDDGEEQDGQNAETGQAALVQPDGERAARHRQPAQGGEMNAKGKHGNWESEKDEIAGK